jgi:hypothetical protein
MDNGQPDETQIADNRYDQRVFFSTIVGMAKLAAAEHYRATGDDNLVTADTILSDLCANLMAAALAGDPSGKLMVALTLKAEKQAAEALEARARRIAEEMEIAAKINGGWGHA